MADAKIVIIGGAADDQDHDIPDNTDPAWRVHQGATDYIAVDTTDGEETVKLISSGTGQVGFGTWVNDYLVPGSDPEEYTDPPPYPFAVHDDLPDAGVLGEFRTTGAQNATIAIRTDGTDRDSRIWLQAPDGGTKWTAGLDSSDGHNFKISKNYDLGGDGGAWDRFIIDFATGVVTIPGGDFHVTGGDVGVGTTEPAAKFHVKATNDSSQWVSKIEADGTTQEALYVKVDGVVGTGVRFDLGTSSHAMLNNGDVGIGTDAPQERLHVANPGTGGSDNAYIKFTTGDTGHGASDGAHIGVSETGTFQIAMDDANDILLMQGASPKLTVNSVGNVALAAGLNVANTGAIGTDGVAIGQSAQAGGNAAVALGRLNSSSGAYGVTAGSGLTASGVKSSAFGVDCTAAHHSSLALGFKANTSFIQSLAMVGTPYAGMGGSQTMMCVGTVETTDDSETYLDTADGSEDLEIFSSPGISKSQVVRIKVVIMSACTTASGTYLRNDFVSREYNFAIQYTYVSSLGRLNSDAIATKVTLATPADIDNFDDGMEVTFSSGPLGIGTPVTTTISSTDKDPASGDYGTFDVTSITGIEPQDYCTDKDPAGGVVPVAGFIGASDVAGGGTSISSGGSMNGSREYVFTDDASNIGSSSAGTGIDDKLYFVTSTDKVSVKFSVTSGESGATVRHVAHITAKTITMD